MVSFEGGVNVREMKYCYANPVVASSHKLDADGESFQKHYKKRARIAISVKNGKKARKISGVDARRNSKPRKEPRKQTTRVVP